MADGDSVYWRDKCSLLESRNADLLSENATLKQDLAAQSEEFAEFEASSKQLEAELEKQCEQSERQVRELSAQLEREAAARERTDAAALESRRTIQRLERELESALGERDELRKSIRELEQANDDLERAKRNALCSLEDLEKNMNEMIERNALLENEIDEKDVLKSQYQRLRDETRELKEELNVQQLRKPPLTSAASTPARPRATSTKSPEPMDTGPPPNRTNIPRSMTVDLGAPPTAAAITPNGRVTALNIVGDLLRKVGALEARLASARMKCPAPTGADEGSPRGPQPKQPHLSGTTSPPSRLPLPVTSPPRSIPPASSRGPT